MLDFTRFRLSLLCVILSVSIVYGKTNEALPFTKIPTQLLAKTTDNPILRKQFKKWSVFQIDENLLFAQAQKNTRPKLELSLGDINIHEEFEPASLFSRSYQILSTQKEAPHTRAIPLNAKTKDGEVRLTTNKDFLYGFVAQDNKTWYIEPLWYFLPNAPKDQVIVYDRADVIDDGMRTCGVTDAQRVHKNLPEEDLPESPLTDCYLVDIAIASDYSMYQKYTSVADVENHNIGVMNNAQSNYIGSFASDFTLNITTQYVVNTNGGDPWTNSTNANSLLPSFKNWGQANGFGTSDYDIAELWTNRDFDGSTIGLSYTGAICTAWQYHVLQDFSNNAAFLRVLVAHEMGHNFDAVSSSDTGHDAPNSGFIMAPSVSTSTTWSPASINDIDNRTASIINGCLPQTSCSGTAATPGINFSANPTNVCAGNTVQFTDLSTENPTSWQWTFPGGTPSSSTDQNPVITYFTPGIYDVQLTATNASGSSTGTLQNYITVTGSPSFTLSASGLTVNFTNTTNPAATSYSWDFGDGSPASTETSPTHTYAQDGSYMVTLTAFNSCGSSTYSITVSVNTPATADFTATPTSLCTGDTVQFTSTSSVNTTQWNWTFEGGTPATSNLENPQVVYNGAGSFNVTLAASSPGGTDVMTKQNYISVTQAAIPGFTFNKAGTTVTFTNTTTPLSGNTYLWHFGENNATSTDIHPTHTYSAPGIYTVTLDVITPSCGTRTITQNVQLILPPVCNFTATPTSGCGPLTVQFTDISTENPTAWVWSFPGGSPATSDVPNPTVIYSTPGQYSVTLSVANVAGGDSKTITNYITVESAPTASFSKVTNANTVTFTNTSTGNPTSYIWDFGDGSATSTETNPSHIYTTDGTFTVTLTAINPCGSHSVTADVIISANTPTANIGVSPSNSVCIGETVSFTANVSSNTQNVDWTFEGGMPAASTDMNPTVTFSAAGSYLVTLTAHNGSNSASANTTITVLPNTTANFATGTSMLTANFTNTSTDATSFAWDFGDNTTSTETNPSHTYIADGTYTVCLIATGPCSTDTFCSQVTISGNGPSAQIESDVTSGCQPLTINYHANISANTSSVEWTFGGGNPATSSLIDQTVVYINPGSYLTTLVGTNPSGQSTDNVQIIVNPTVNSAFSSALDGPTASFTDLSSGNPTSYSWDFGDGNTSTDANPSHQYSSSGNYNVCLTTSNPCGSHTTCQSLVIPDFLPTASIVTDSPLTGCEPMSVNFHADVTNPGSVNWTFEGGTPATSNSINQTVVFSSPGTHTVTLSASNAYGTTFAIPESVTVNPKPIANFAVNVNGHLVTTNNFSQNATSQIWDFGDGTILTGFNPGHLYAVDTVTDIILIVTNNCGSDTMTITETIGSAPSVAPTASVSSGCAPLSVAFQAHAQNSNDIQWTFPTGNPTSSTEADPTVVFTTPGTHTATVIASNSISSDTQQVEITVMPATTSSFNYNLDNDHQVTFSSTSQNATSLLWVFGDNQTATNIVNATHTYGDGDFTAMLIATGTCNSDTSYQLFSFGSTAPPDVNLSASGAEGCIPYTVTYTAALSSNTESFTWEFPGGNPATSQDSVVDVTYSIAGTYPAYLYGTNEFGTDTADYEVTIHPQASAQFNFGVNGLTVTTTNNSTNADSYLWTFGDGTSSMLENPVHTYAGNGNYDIILRATNFCGVDSTSRNLLIVGIDDPLNEVSIELYPNPSNGIYTLDVQSIKADQIDISIYDILGRKVMEKNWSKTQKIHEDISIENQPAGNYIFQLNYQGRILTGKIVKM
ncbi:MAG TPA: PKD domain-containing protein [Saprospiraceae bacterium]|nr:PKD domain-containing protein [Saprospiraceae bacterium]